MIIRALRSRLPNDNWTRFLLVPALVFIATAVLRNYQTDLWHHLARGRVMVEAQSLLDHDLFTYTVEGQPLQDANWAWQVSFYRLYQLGGLALVQLANSLLLTLTLTLLLVRTWKRCGSLLVAAAACVFTLFGLWQLLIIRPQTVSFLLFVILHGALEAGVIRRRRLLLAPVVMGVWVNCHGGFPVGLALIGCYALAAFLESPAPVVEDDRPAWRRQLLPRVQAALPWGLCLVASVAATLVNPYGWHVYEYVGLTSSVAPARGIEEWLPPGLHLLVSKIWVVSILLLLGLFALQGKRPSVRELCLIGVFLPAACGSVRMVAWWLLLCTPILATQVMALWSRYFTAEPDARPSWGNAAACGLMLAAMVLSVPALERFNPLFALPGRAHRTEYDLQAVADHLAEGGPTGRIFTCFEWGEYLGWSLGPGYQVFMDGRIEIFPDEVWREYSAVTRGRADWEAILDRYQVSCLVLDTSGYHHELLPQVRRSPAWRETLCQGDAVVFERRPEAGWRSARR
jgi:hypothetical protein